MFNADELQQIVKQGVHSIATTSNPCVSCKSKPIHFHGSDIGKCRLATWYNRNAVEDKPISQDLAALFLDGHLHERIIIEAIKDRGYNIEQGLEFDVVHHISLDIFVSYLSTIYLPDEVRKELIKQANIDNEIRLIGHTDGILNLDGERILIEIKAVKSANFNYKFMKGIMPDYYYGQIQSYLNCLRLDRGFLIAKNREDGTIAKPILVHKNETYFKKQLCELLIVKLNQGVLDPYKRTITKPFRDGKGYECKYCDYKEKCWG